MILAQTHIINNTKIDMMMMTLNTIIIQTILPLLIIITTITIIVTII